MASRLRVFLFFFHYSFDLNADGLSDIVVYPRWFFRYSSSGVFLVVRFGSLCAFFNPVPVLWFRKSVVRLCS